MWHIAGPDALVLVHTNGVYINFVTRQLGLSNPSCEPIVGKFSLTPSLLYIMTVQGCLSRAGMTQCHAAV